MKVGLCSCYPEFFMRNFTTSPNSFCCN
uniref:Uncharacterized protein n=1 Tax=Rhizophora mucronata TaxID=61149 RepID=A0A2P2J1B9_RHIMU